MGEKILITVIEFREETERKREREKKQNREDRRKEKRNREVVLCDYHSVCLKYNRPALFIDSYRTAIK